MKARLADKLLSEMIEMAEEQLGSRSEKNVVPGCDKTGAKRGEMHATLRPTAWLFKAQTRPEPGRGPTVFPRREVPGRSSNRYSAPPASARPTYSRVSVRGSFERRIRDMCPTRCIRRVGR